MLIIGEISYLVLFQSYARAISIFSVANVVFSSALKITKSCTMSRFAQLAECPDLERVKQKLVNVQNFKLLL